MPGEGPGLVESFFQGRALRRRDREATQREQLLQLQLEQAEQAREATRQLPETLSGLAAAVQSTVPGPLVPGPVFPEALPLESPDRAAAIEAEPAPLIPGPPVPGPPVPRFGSTPAFLADPSNARLVAQGLRAGVNPIAAVTGGFPSIEAARDARDVHDRQQSGQAEVEGGLSDLHAAGDDDATLRALTRIASGRVRLGDTGAVRELTAAVTSARDKADIARDAKVYAPILSAAFGAGATDATKAAALDAFFKDPQSPYFLAVGPKLFERVLGTLGPEWTAMQRFLVWRQATPGMAQLPDLQAWMVWQQTVPGAALEATVAEKGGYVPTAVRQHLGFEQALATRQAAEAAKSPEDRELEREGKRSLIAQRRALTEHRQLLTQARRLAADPLADPKALTAMVKSLTETRKNTELFDFRSPAEKGAFLATTDELLNALQGRLQGAVTPARPLPSLRGGGPQPTVDAEDVARVRAAVGGGGGGAERTADLVRRRAEIDRLARADGGPPFESRSREQQRALRDQADRNLGVGR